MADIFPVLSKAPDQSIAESYDDQTLSSKSEFGYVFTRPRSTKISRILTISYSRLPQSDHDLLDAFVRTTTLGGSGSFLWADPRTAEQLTVRFTKPPQFQDAGYAVQKTDPAAPDIPVVEGKSYNATFEITEV